MSIKTNKSSRPVAPKAAAAAPKAAAPKATNTVKLPGKEAYSSFPGFPNKDDRTPPAKQADGYSVLIADGASPNVSANGVAAPAGVEAGKAFRVNYYKSFAVPENDVKTVKLHYKIDGQEYPAVDLAIRAQTG